MARRVYGIRADKAAHWLFETANHLDTWAQLLRDRAWAIATPPEGVTHASQEGTVRFPIHPDLDRLQGFTPQGFTWSGQEGVPGGTYSYGEGRWLDSVQDPED